MRTLTCDQPDWSIGSCGLANPVQHYVHVLCDRLKGGRLVINDLIRPILKKAGVALGIRRGDHARSQLMSKLQGDAAHGSASSMDQDHLPGSQMRLFQRLHRGLSHKGQRIRLHRAECAGLVCGLVGFDGDELRVGPYAYSAAEHFAPNVEARDTLAERVNRAGKVRTCRISCS
jgi:hypothetical protein